MPGFRIDAHVLSSDISVKQVPSDIVIVSVSCEHLGVTISKLVGVGDKCFAVNTEAYRVCCQPSLSAIFSLSTDTANKFGVLEVNLYPRFLVVKATEIECFILILNFHLMCALVYMMYS